MCMQDGVAWDWGGCIHLDGAARVLLSKKNVMNLGSQLSESVTNVTSFQDCLCNCQNGKKLSKKIKVIRVVKIVQTVKNCQKYLNVVKIVKNVKNYQNCKRFVKNYSKLSKIVKSTKKCQNVGQVLFFIK